LLEAVMDVKKGHQFGQVEHAGDRVIVCDADKVQPAADTVVVGEFLGSLIPRVRGRCCGGFATAAGCCRCRGCSRS
jgi:hypothetical protein